MQLHTKANIPYIGTYQSAYNKIECEQTRDTASSVLAYPALKWLVEIDKQMQINQITPSDYTSATEMENFLESMGFKSVIRMRNRMAYIQSATKICVYIEHRVAQLQADPANHAVCSVLLSAMGIGNGNVTRYNITKYFAKACNMVGPVDRLPTMSRLQIPEPQLTRNATALIREYRKLVYNTSASSTIAQIIKCKRIEDITKITHNGNIYAGVYRVCEFLKFTDFCAYAVASEGTRVYSQIILSLLHDEDNSDDAVSNKLSLAQRTYARYKQNALFWFSFLLWGTEETNIVCK